MSSKQVQEVEVLQSRTYTYPTGCGKIYITVASDDGGKPHRCFITIGKAGLCIACHMGALGSMIGRALRAGDTLEDIAGELCGLSCQKPALENGIRTMSCVDAVGQALREHVSTMKQAEADTEQR